MTSRENQEYESKIIILDINAILLNCGCFIYKVGLYTSTQIQSVRPQSFRTHTHTFFLSIILLEKHTPIKSSYEQLVNVMKDTEKLGILLLDRKIKLMVVA